MIFELWKAVFVYYAIYSNKIEKG